MKSKLFWNQDVGWYRRLARKHLGLWRFVAGIIRIAGVRSLIEIGGGPGFTRNRVQSYLNIERNRQCAIWPDTLCGDWLKIDASWFRRMKPDMILACGVIEHCPSYDEFLGRIVAASPRLAVVSFFRGLRPNGRSKLTKLPVTVADGGEDIWCNWYSRPAIEHWLRRKRLLDRASFWQIRKPHQHNLNDMVIVLDFRQQGIAAKLGDDHKITALAEYL